MPMSRRRYAIVVLALAVIGCAAHWPALRSGLIADDYLQRSMLDGSYPVHRSPLDLFSFVDASRGELAPLENAGTLPWWVHPRLELRLLRPLSSLLITLDARVLRLSPYPQHLHSLVWWLALLLVLAAFLRDRAPPAVALGAVAVFAFDPASTTAVGWIASRCVVVCAVFGLLALWAHIAWRERGWRPGPYLAAAAFALSLAGGEYALGMFGYLLAYELAAGRGGVKRRLGSLLPVALPLAAYLALHVALGYGARGSSTYIDPLHRPLVFASAALARLPVLLVGQLLNVELAISTHAWQLPALLVLLLLVAVLALAPGALRRLEPGPRKSVLFLLLGSALSMLPAVATVPLPRLLLIPALGGSVFIAVLIVDAARRLREAGALRRPGVWFGSLVALGLFGSHVLGALGTTYAASQNWSAAQQRAQHLYLAAPLDDRTLAKQTVVLVNSFEIATLIYPPYVRHLHGSPMPRAWRALATTWQPVTLHRTASDTLELDAKQGALLTRSTVDVLRAADLPLRAGQHFHVRGMDVTVLAMDGWGPSRVRYRFDGDLDASRFVFLTMSPAGLMRLHLPKPGGSLELPGAPALLAQLAGP